MLWNSECPEKWQRCLRCHWLTRLIQYLNRSPSDPHHSLDWNRRGSPLNELHGIQVEGKDSHLTNRAGDDVSSGCFGFKWSQQQSQQHWQQSQQDYIYWTRVDSSPATSQSFIILLVVSLVPLIFGRLYFLVRYPSGNSLCIPVWHSSGEKFFISSLPLTVFDTRLKNSMSSIHDISINIFISSCFPRKGNEEEDQSMVVNSFGLKKTPNVMTPMGTLITWCANTSTTETTTKSILRFVHHNLHSLL